MRYNSKKIRAGWASKNMPRLGGEDDQGAESHAAEMALAFAATVRQLARKTRESAHRRARKRERGMDALCFRILFLYANLNF